MNSSIVDNLHQTFSAYKAEKKQGHKVYIEANEAKNHLQLSSTKNIRLNEVFKKAVSYLKQEKECETSEQATNQLIKLQCLLKDSKDVYRYYCKKTNTWGRAFLKLVNRFSPFFLKVFFPSIFSHPIKAAEQATQQNFTAYTAYLQEACRLLKIKKENLEAALLEEPAELPLAEPDDNFPNDDSPKAAIPPQNTDAEAEQLQLLTYMEDEFNNLDQEPPGVPYVEFHAHHQPARIEPIELVGNLPPIDVQQEIEQPQQPPIADLTNQTTQKVVDAFAQQIRADLQALNATVQTPISFLHFIKILNHLKLNFSKLTTLLSPVELQQCLEELHIDESFLNTLMQERFRNSEDEEVNEILQSIAWGKSFKTAREQNEVGQLVVRKIANTTFFRFKSSTGEKGEKYFDEYKQVLIVKADHLEDLRTLMASKPNCQPSCLIIQFEEDADFSKEDVLAILEWSKKIAQIKIPGIKEISFEALRLSEDEEKQLIALFPALECNSLQSLVLSNQQNRYTVEQLSTALAFFPSLTLLKQCTQLTSTPLEIKLPVQLMANSEMAFDKNFSIELMAYLIQYSPRLQTIQLESLVIIDAQIAEWGAQGYLDHLQKIDLRACPQLTTDVIPALAKLPNLGQVDLSEEMPLGTIKDLPIFEDPFKVAQFYIQPQVTRKHARQLYAGPTEWASAFQIPLAKKGEAYIFSAADEILGPQALSYWLYQDSFQNLQRQENVKALLFDESTLINDNNLLEFVKKFPKVSYLSLQNCPYITNKGIQSVLDDLSHIRSIDLTGCRGINDNLLANEQNTAKIAKLRLLNLSGTSVSKALLQNFHGRLQLLNESTKIFFKPYSLKITNEDLGENCELLEEFLEKQNLNTFIYLDLEDCTALTDAALKKVLKRLNVDAVLFGAGPERKNPQRLNIAKLNLKGCSQITDDAFIINPGKDSDEELVDVPEKKDLLYLGRLQSIWIEGTQVSEAVQKAYPAITFAPEVHDPDQQLADYIAKMAHGAKFNYTHKRIFLSLFGHLCEDQNKAAAINLRPFNPLEETNSDLALSFATYENEALFSQFNAHKEVLYSQSTYFRNMLRPGGEASKEAVISLINQNATPEAVKIVMDILYGREWDVKTDWQVLTNAAELISDRCLKLTATPYRKLLAAIHKQFDFSRAFEMLMRAYQLEDLEGFKFYEKELLNLLRADINLAQQMSDLARSFAINPYTLKELQGQSGRILAIEAERALRRADGLELDRLNAEAIRQALED
jgi:hypothetical protein